jgi:hypothetical protein
MQSMIQMDLAPQSDGRANGLRYPNKNGNAPQPMIEGIPVIAELMSLLGNVNPVAGNDDLCPFARNSIFATFEAFAAELFVEGVNLPGGAVVVVPICAIGVVPSLVAVVPVAPVAVVVSPMIFLDDPICRGGYR